MRSRGASPPCRSARHYEIGKPNPRRGKHLDAFYVGLRVTALEGRLQIAEPENSDHLGLVCTISIGT